MTHTPQKNLVLITRPHEQAEDFARTLNEYAIKCLCAPVLEYHPLETSLPDLTVYDGLIFTSANGLHILNDISAPRIPVFTVGDKTAKSAIESGFSDVHSANGNADDLGELLDKSFGQRPAKLLHVCGLNNKEINVQHKNIHIEQCVTYRMNRMKELSPAAIDSLRTGHIECVTFFSRRSAENFIKLIEHHDLTSCLPSISALCISNSVLKCVQDLKWKTVAAARYPTRTAMIELITGNKQS